MHICFNWESEILMKEVLFYKYNLVKNFYNKTYLQLFPDKKIEEFNSIDSSKDILESII